MFETGDIPITPEVLTLIAEIDEFTRAWRAPGTLAPARLSALRRVATIESIGSSTRIEGSKLSDRDVERLPEAPDKSTELVQAPDRIRWHVSQLVTQVMERTLGLRHGRSGLPAGLRQSIEYRGSGHSNCS